MSEQHYYRTRRAFNNAQSAWDNACPPDDDDDYSDYCQGCNPEPTIEELDSGVCASCGKELA